MVAAENCPSFAKDEDDNFEEAKYARKSCRISKTVTSVQQESGYGAGQAVFRAQQVPRGYRWTAAEGEKETR